MKKIMLFALLVAVSLMITSNVSAKPTEAGGHLMAGSSFLLTACTVDGVTYPVDSYAQIWAVNNFGQWVVIGRITFGGPSGYIAIRLDGVTFPAYCS